MRIEKSSIHRAIFRDRIRDLFSQPAANSVFLWEAFRLIKLELPSPWPEITPSAETNSLIQRSKCIECRYEDGCLICARRRHYHHKGFRFPPLHRDALCLLVGRSEIYLLFGPLSQE